MNIARLNPKIDFMLQRIGNGWVIMQIDYATPSAAPPTASGQ